MKRLFGHLFTLASLVSLLVCVAVALLWARSNRLDVAQVYYNRLPGPDEFYTNYFEAASYSGTLRLRLHHRHVEPVYFRSRPRTLKEFATLHPPELRWAGSVGASVDGSRPSGFGAGHEVSTPRPGYRSDNWYVAVPAWLAMALLLVMPALWMNQVRKTRRARRLRLCPGCGYDLRATPDRCPECGAVPPEAAA